MNRFFLVFLVMSLASSIFATNTPTKPDQPTLCGGYSPAAIDPEVRKVAEFAVKAQAKASEKPLQLVKILKVERQVVAGLNYRLEIEVADGSKRMIIFGSLKFCQAKPRSRERQ